MDKKVAIFPGSFDPFTKGHEDIVLRGIKMFDEIIIGMGYNGKKSRYFHIDTMLDCVDETFKDYPNISVETYNELTVHFAKKHNADFLLRGLRNTTDFEYENSIAQANRHVFKDIETVFLITSPEYAYISSSIIREMHKYGKTLTEFLPYDVSRFLRKN